MKGTHNCDMPLDGRLNALLCILQLRVFKYVSHMHTDDPRRIQVDAHGPGQTTPLTSHGHETMNWP